MFLSHILSNEVSQLLEEILKFDTRLPLEEFFKVAQNFHNSLLKDENVAMLYVDGILTVLEKYSFYYQKPFIWGESNNSWYYKSESVFRDGVETYWRVHVGFDWNYNDNEKTGKIKKLNSAKGIFRVKLKNRAIINTY